MSASIIKRIFALSVISLNLLVSVFGQGLREPSSIRIIPTNYAPEISASEVFEEINYVPLETTKRSVFGALQQLIVTKDHFILSDRETNCIFVFYKNGKFLSKIVRQPSERQLFWVDQNKQEIIFMIGMKSFHYYSYNGSKLRVETKSKLEFSVDSHFFQDGITAYSAYIVNEKFFKDTVNHEVLLARNDKVYASFLPYNMKNSALTTDNLPNREQGPFFASGNSSWVYYARPYDYNVYKVTTSDMYEKFTFVFPSENSFSKANFNDPLFKRDARQYFRSNPDLISRISHIYQIDSCISFKLTTAGKKFGPMLYNLKNQTLVSFLSINPDSKSYFMPVNDSKDVSGFADQGALYCDGKYFYSSVSSSALIVRRKQNIDKNIMYPKVLSAYFEKASMMDNPVILQIKPKQSF